MRSQGVNAELIGQMLADQLMAKSKAKKPTGYSASPSKLPDIEEWASKYFYVVETGKPIQLMPHQLDILRLFSEQRGDGQFKWTTLIYSTIKKSGKTTISALYARWAAETWGPFREIYNMGNKLKQAKERAFKLARRSIELSPYKNEWDIAETKMTHLPSGSFIEALPVAGAGEAGGNQSLSVWTELWGFEHDAALLMWDELKPVPTNPLSQRFVDTYAGFEGESELLKGYWDLALSGERLHDELPVYGVPEAGLIAYIDTGPEARRMPWQTPEYYRQQELSESRSSYDRHHNNWWTNSETKLINIAVWDGLPASPSFNKFTRVVAAIDASVSGDCCAVTAVAYDNEGDVVMEVESHIFEPPKGGKIDYAQTIRPAIDGIRERYRLISIRYDPYQLHDFMTQLKKVPEYRGIEIEEFTQSNLRVLADSALLSRIKQSKIAHKHSQATREHVQNAHGKEVGDNAIRIVKASPLKKIDWIVTLSMAAHVATELFQHGDSSAVRQVRHNLYGPKRR